MSLLWTSLSGARALRSPLALPALPQADPAHRAARAHLPHARSGLHPTRRPERPASPSAPLPGLSGHLIARRVTAAVAAQQHADWPLASASHASVADKAPAPAVCWLLCAAQACACACLQSRQSLVQDAGPNKAAHTAEKQRCGADGRAAPPILGACGGRLPAARPAACARKGGGRARVIAAALHLCGARRGQQACTLHIDGHQPDTCTPTTHATHRECWVLFCNVLASGPFNAVGRAWLPSCREAPWRPDSGAVVWLGVQDADWHGRIERASGRGPARQGGLRQRRRGWRAAQCACTMRQGAWAYTFPPPSGDLLLGSKRALQRRPAPMPACPHHLAAFVLFAAHARRVASAACQVSCF